MIKQKKVRNIVEPMEPINGTITPCIGLTQAVKQATWKSIDLVLKIGKFNVWIKSIVYPTKTKADPNQSSTSSVTGNIIGNLIQGAINAM